MPDTVTGPSRIVNETALGIYVMSWTDGPDKRRCVLSWYPGLDVPRFEFHVGSTGRMSPPIRVPQPQLDKLRWAEPKGKTGVKTFRDFAGRYAAMMHQAFEEDDSDG